MSGTWPAGAPPGNRARNDGLIVAVSETLAGFEVAPRRDWPPENCRGQLSQNTMHRMAAFVGSVLAIGVVLPRSVTVFTSVSPFGDAHGKNLMLSITQPAPQCPSAHRETHKD